MSRPIVLHLERVKPLSVKEELAVVRAAYARSSSPVLRVKLARLLMADGDMGALSALLADQPGLGAREELLLAEALLAYESQDGDALAWAACDRATEAAGDGVERAASLALRGKAETRLGRVDDARASLAAALELDPHNKDACKRLAALDLAAGDCAAVIALYERLHRQGVAHSRLFAARAVAAARLGDIGSARAMIGSETFLSARKLPPPPGWSSIEAFNAALAEELLAHPEMRYERYGSASELTWRVDWMPHRAAPLTRLLIDSLVAAITSHVQTIAGSNHPWAAAQPADALLRTWSVITESQGFENWHVHQFGWLSGAYYVRVPETIANGDTDAGCIALGLPEDLAGEDAAIAYGTRTIRPQDGLLLLFPSHTYHRTFPHGVRERRICIAFDVKPLALHAEETAAAA